MPDSFWYDVSITSIRYLRGAGSASDIANRVEREVADGRLKPGTLLPPVRELAAGLEVAPGTVAAAYRLLAQRGITQGRGRLGTRVALGPPVLAPLPPELPAGVRDLSRGNPDPALLPDLADAYAAAARQPPPLYGQPAVEPSLGAAARSALAADGIPTEALTVVSGALDGLERVLAATLRPGDRVVVEDPGYPRVFDLLGALGLHAVPVAVDDRGPVPDELARALAGADAVVITPRAQNPVGAALDAERRRELARLLRRHPDALVVEDDHAGPVAGQPAEGLNDGRRARWATLRSVAKSFGPDLRVAIVAGDPTTVTRVEGRHRVGPGWVSYTLQRVAASLWSDPAMPAVLDRAARTYAARREALIAALAARGIGAHGRSGMNVWIPVAEEHPVATGLLARGWGVATGERFRLRSGPAVRVTTSTLTEAEAERLAADVAACVAPATTVTGWA